MQTGGFLNVQAVFVAQATRQGQSTCAEVIPDGAAHLLSGGLGGLGLLTARLLIEGCASQLILMSRSDRVQTRCAIQRRMWH